MTNTKYSMTAAEVSHVRHEICVANDTAKAVCSTILKGAASVTAQSLLRQTTEKLDEILEFIDGQRTEQDSVKTINTSTQSCGAERMWDAILVDDDPLVHGSWKLQARQMGKELLIYASAEELLANIEALNPKTPVYIDFRFKKDQMQGVALVEELFRRGFRELYFSTGLSQHDVPVTDKIKGVRGKKPPWTM